VKRRTLLVTGVLAALGFAIGWFTAHQSARTGNRILIVSGTSRDGADGEKYLKNDIDISKLDWVSPTDLATFCEIDGFTLVNSSESIEEVEIDIETTPTIKLNCIFENGKLAVRPPVDDPEIGKILAKQAVWYRLEDRP
jgi:hypothetical protein